jgi:hypothetical protein
MGVFQKKQPYSRKARGAQLVARYPGQPDALVGGDAVREWQRRGSGCSLGCVVSSYRLNDVLWRDVRRRS